MKLKYYMRGMGMGILFTMFVFIVIIIPNLQLENKMNSEKVDETAVNNELSALLGTSSSTAEETITDAPVVTTDAITDAPVEAPSPTLVPTEIVSPSPTLAPTEIVTPSPTPTPTLAPTEIVTPSPTPTVAATIVPSQTVTSAPTEMPVQDSEDFFTLKITYGMTSEQVSSALQKAGVVDSWLELNTYIVKHGFARKINVGTFHFKKDMSYEEVCKIITG